MQKGHAGLMCLAAAIFFSVASISWGDSLRQRPPSEPQVPHPTAEQPQPPASSTPKNAGQAAPSAQPQENPQANADQNAPSTPEHQGGAHPDSGQAGRPPRGENTPAAQAASPGEETGQERVPQADDRPETGAPTANMPQNGSSPERETANMPQNESTPEREDFLSLPDGPANALSNKDDALVLPEPAKDLRFAEGAWRFDRTFTGPDGKPVETSFVFNALGMGSSTLTTSNNERFTASATATVEDGTLKIQTSRYANENHTAFFPGMFLECRNGRDAALCKGTDGWKVWSNEHLLATDSTAASSARRAAAERRNSSQTDSTAEHRQQGSWHSADSTTVIHENSAGTEAQHALPNPAEEAANRFAELFDGGAELPPAILQHAEKARYSSGSKVSPLQGDWRYSQDFARKSDGNSVGLEFHFDKDGNGSSVIKDAVQGDARAKAQVITLPNGTLRVKTDAYAGSNGQRYYPTFMECRPGHNKVLECDVSNGWMRLNKGALVSLDSIQRQDKGMAMEELIPTAAAQGGQGSGGGQGKGQTANTEDLLAAMSESAGSGSQGQTASTEDLLAAMSESTESSQSRTAMQKHSSEQVVLPKNSTSTTFLKGRWRCNTGLVRVNDGQPVVVSFAFGTNGKGTSTIREQSGRVYTASANATLRNGILRINTSDFYAPNVNGKYLGQIMECRQDRDHVLCSGKSRDNSNSWHKATFTPIR